jgi:HEPN domain-containing protein
MKNETKAWLDYAAENYKSAEVLFKNGLFNACLQNIQQSAEKYLKSLLIERGTGLIKSHSIRQLLHALIEHQITISMSEDEIDLLDSIYLPSKYPLISVLPEFLPDKKLCETCMTIASSIKNSVLDSLKIKR